MILLKRFLIRHNYSLGDKSETAFSFLLLRETFCCICIEFGLKLVIRANEALDEAIVKLF